MFPTAGTCVRLAHLLSDPALLAVEAHLRRPHVLQRLFGQDEAESLQSRCCRGPRGRSEPTLVLLHHLEHTWMHTHPQPIREQEQDGNTVSKMNDNVKANNVTLLSLRCQTIIFQNT